MDYKKYSSVIDHAEVPDADGSIGVDARWGGGAFLIPFPHPFVPFPSLNNRLLMAIKTAI